MAYNVTGTAGNDALNQSTDTGPGTIVGLAGDDTISTGSGLATVTGDSGNDSILTRTGNTGTVSGGTENDSIFGPTGVGSMQTFGNAGNDTINFDAASSAQTIVGGDDSSDGADSVWTGNGNDFIFGNGGNDSVLTRLGSDTFVGGFGNDSVSKNLDLAGHDVIFGNQGNDSVWVSGGNDTVWSGLGNDSIFHDTAGNPLFFGNEGNDTIDANGATGATVVGGNDSADGNDSIRGGTGAEFIFGNGGNDTVDAGDGANTLVGGFGGDSFQSGNGNDLVFLNESNDTVTDIGGNNTIFGGLGNDCILDVSTGASTIQGNEGNDSIRARQGIDTLSGGTGNDVFDYFSPDDDGQNAAGGGPVEFITDVNWAEDRFDATTAITFATNTGAGTGGTLADSANNAINAATALNGGVNTVAAQFTFSGRTYLAINLAVDGFLDANDLLLDITGATGTISGTNFIWTASGGTHIPQGAAKAAPSFVQRRPHALTSLMGEKPR